MKKQTAVEWLEEMIECGADLDIIKKCIPKAKVMEKEHMSDSFENGVEADYYSDFENYYNKIFSK